MFSELQLGISAREVELGEIRPRFLSADQRLMKRPVGAAQAVEADGRQRQRRSSSCLCDRIFWPASELASACVSVLFVFLSVGFSF